MKKEFVIGLSLLHQLAGFPPCETWEEHAGKVKHTCSAETEGKE